jgi:hypothetical protein
VPDLTTGVVAPAMSAAPALPMPQLSPNLTALPGHAIAQVATMLGRALAPAPVLTPVALDVAPELPPAVEEPAAVQDCSAALSAVAQSPGMAALALDAPCAPSQAVILHHDGLRFTILTDLAGQAQVSVPALSVDAVFVIDLGQGLGAIAQITLPEVALLDRAVLQGQAGQGLALHAFADGATFGQPGHIWRDTPADAASTAGFLTRLGDDSLEGGLVAEVFTFPAGASGAVTLAAEAEVTAANCGQAVVAQTLQLSPGAPVFTRDLTLTMPDCAATGEYLMLPDALFDITVAAN